MKIPVFYRAGYAFKPTTCAECGVAIAPSNGNGKGPTSAYVATVIETVRGSMSVSARIACVTCGPIKRVEAGLPA